MLCGCRAPSSRLSEREKDRLERGQHWFAWRLLKPRKELFMKGAPLPPIGRLNTALVLHDMQNDFIKASLAKLEMQAVVKRTKALIHLAHALPIPVIYTRAEYDPAVGFPADRAEYLRRAGPTNCVKGTEGAEVINELKPG